MYSKEFTRKLKLIGMFCSEEQDMENEANTSLFKLIIVRLITYFTNI